MGEKFNLGELMARQTAAPVASRDIEIITEEILSLKKTAGEAVLGIGQRLNEAKAVLPHGAWQAWLTERVEFSERTAQNFMRLAREWSNPQALADLGATKALTLLALPQEEREQFISEHHLVGGEEKTVIDMTSRELEQALRDREEALAEKKAAEEAREKMATDMEHANKRIEELSGQIDAAGDAVLKAEEKTRQLEKELEQLKAQPKDVAIMEVDQAALDKARADAIAEMQDKLDKAKAAKEKAEEKRKAAEADLEAAREKLAEAEKAQKATVISNDKDLVEFKVYFDQAKEAANKLHGLLLKARGREDQELAEKLQKAMIALGESIGRAAE